MSQRLVGYGVSQVPTNGMLGGMAYQDPINVTVNNISVDSGTLTVSAGTTALPSISPSGDSNTGIFFPSADTLAVVTAGSNRLHITSGGLVGIGSATPSATLQVDASGGGTIRILRSSVGANYFQFEHDGTNGTINSFGATGNLLFIVNSTERMRIKNNGETRCFSANGTSTIELRNGSSSGTSNRLLYGLHSATDITNGTPIYSIFTNGTIGTPSDIRLKKNVESTRDGYLDDINDLRVVKYHWKTQDDAEPKELGLIAQEVEEVFPGLIHTEGEGDSEVKEIKRSVIPFILLKALQEADAKIEAQQVVINDLLARVTALERA